MKRRVRVDTIALVVVLVLTGVVIYVNVAPGGAIRSRYDAFQRTRTLRKSIEARWDSLLALSSPLDSSGRKDVIFEVSDYQCPFCRQFDAALKSAPEVKAHIRLLHFPLSNHPHAFGAAAAAICAEHQGVFPTMHRLLFTNQSWSEEGDFEAVISQAPLPDPIAFRDCLKSPVTHDHILKGISLVRRLGISATPTFITRRSVTRGMVSPDSLMLVTSEQ